MPSLSGSGKGVVAMVTYSDLFTFVIMIVAILTYIDSHNNKKK
jgi:hypothetical protein|nr:MAG TPA: Membrane MotB of proton-channel complex MotA/MotB [Caudoviricetes sp.]